MSRGPFFRSSLATRLSWLVAAIFVLAVINFVLDYLTIQDLRNAALQKLKQNMFVQHKRQLKALGETMSMVLGKGVAAHKSRDAKEAYIRNLINPIRFFKNKSGYFFVFRMDGYRVAIPPFPRLVGTSAQDDDRRVFLLFRANALAGGGFSQWDWQKPGKPGKQPKLGYVKPIPGTDMFVCTGVYIDDVEEQMQIVAAQFDRSSRRLFLRTAGVFFAVILLLLLLGGLFLHSSILRPIQKMSKAAEQVREGHFDVELEHHSGDEMGRLVATFRDMIETRKHAEHAQKMESIGRLAGGIAHDFNNLLGGILGAAELLEEALFQEQDAYQHVVLIRDAALTAADFTRQLLAFSRNSTTTHQCVDLHVLIRDVGQLLQHATDRRSKLIMACQATSSWVYADAILLQRMLLNLGLNAYAAMPNGGELHIRTQNKEIETPLAVGYEASIPVGTYIEMTVEDQGKGMSRETMQHIFEPFFTTKDVGEGTGLGLSVVYGVVQAHKGSIQVSSEEGKGTRFTILLPVVEPEPKPISSTEAIEPKQPGGRILVIDDESVIRKLFQNVLSRHGYEVTVASDGMQGIERYVQAGMDFDVVLLDILMPGMDGDEVFRRLRVLNPHAKVIFMSGFSRETTASELLAKGAAGFLHKPFRLHELREMLAQVLGGPPTKER